MFKTNEVNLGEILSQVEKGEIQFPEFQRGWVWDDAGIRDLLLSVIKGFPIGAITEIEAGDAVKFKNRPIEGVSIDEDTKPESYLLDGQQRLTSLYQSMKHDGAVETRVRSREARRYYYINIQAAIDPNSDEDDIVVSVDETKRVTSKFGRSIQLDLSTDKLEYKHHLIPTEKLLSPSTVWHFPYIRFWQDEDPKYDAFGKIEKFDTKVVDPLKGYTMPVIMLDKDVPREAVCAIFEKVNTGGVRLNVFELLTAMLAADGLDLRRDWDAMREAMHQHDVLRAVSNDRFLQAVSLVATLSRARMSGSSDHLEGIGCQRRHILSLTRAEYEHWAPNVRDGFVRSAEFLADVHVFSARDLPYAAQLVSLAALFVEMGNELLAQGKREKLKRWFWSGVFGENYGSSSESRNAVDLLTVPNFLRGNVSTLEILELASFEPQRLVSLRTRQSAAYKGIHALLMNNGCIDWHSGAPIDVNRFFGRNIDIHHVFPKAWCEQRSATKLGVRIPPRIFNSAINKAPLSAETNRRIGGRAPSRYLDSLRKDYPEVDRAVERSFVDPNTLRDDNFVMFFVKRGVALTKLIHDAMGKDTPDCEQAFRNVLTRENLAHETDGYDDSVADEPDIVIPIA